MINLTTRSALGQNGVHGGAGVGAGRFASREAAVDLGLGDDRQGFFLNLDQSSSDRFLDPVSFDAFHDHGENQRGFARYDRAKTDGSFSFRLTGNYGRTDRDVTNLPSQQDAGQDQVVKTRDWNLNAGIEKISGEGLLEAQVFARSGRLRLLPSAGDTPVTASADRTLETRGANLSYTHQLGFHELRGRPPGQAVPDRGEVLLRRRRPRLQRPGSRGVESQPPARAT